ncbi:calponin [Ophidiomyces ophidiicola]|nr:calponin [Ophidiomyces ophidiicola]KAI2042170.1 calponin [Ophidiomyces ophidiicola]KAI2044168.1 calponin [Ophidiomyces ophidiicola]KAI2088150.1 calponin [Ophidiomyces ophidiicola]KAI2089173.1 calponin [Ophidiomyces ophidiicola]
MASVTSLDKDLKNLRLSRYTPQAANEVRGWIEEVLRESLPSGDLLEALKDGVVLCRLLNLAVGSPGVKYKASKMPFVQMENISHFLHACQMAPLNLQPHDVFLTVDLYESKDPAQVLQCLVAFSRRANALEPAKFPRAIGKVKSGFVSPQLSGSSQGGFKGMTSYNRMSGISSISESGSRTFNPISGRSSPEKPSPASPASPRSPRLAVSTWSNKADESTTAPAWNIHQYGYMGGASQGNLGISFGARRQITSQAPTVPSLAQKEKMRREAAEQEEKQRREIEKAERQRGIEEQQAREEEEQRWEEETRKLREKERIAAEEEKKRWADEQRQWEEEDRRRQLEEREAEEKLEKERQRKRELADSRLNGQFLSQYQASQRLERGSSPGESMPTPERERIQALERELELAKQRERQYERERQEFSRSRQVSNTSQVSQTSATRGRALPPKPAKPSFDLTSQEEERRLLRSEWQANQDNRLEQIEPSPPPPSLPPRSLPEPPLSPRPLPDPSNYPKTRTDRFLATNPAPQPTQPTSHRPFEFSTEREVDEENHRRIASTQKTRAGGWASKSLLEREMERERERQREWEENQKRTTDAVKQGVNSAGTGPGEGGWDVNQYGYIGGDNQNRGATGIGFGARRQIIGPRPPR